MKKLWNNFIGGLYLAEGLNLVLILFMIGPLIWAMIRIGELERKVIYEPISSIPTMKPEPLLVEIQSFEENVILGSVELLWGTPYYSITVPSLVSNESFTVSLVMDTKLIDNDSTEYIYDIPYSQTIVTSTIDINGDGFIDKKDLVILKENYGAEATDINKDGIVDIFDVVVVAYNLDEKGTGLFSTINYTIPVPSTINQQTEEWIRPHWVVTSTDIVYLESTGEVFTSSLAMPIWYWLDWTNHLVESDSEGFYHNRTVQLGWAHRIWLPIIMKGK